MLKVDKIHKMRGEGNSEDRLPELRISEKKKGEQER